MTITYILRTSLTDQTRTFVSLTGAESAFDAAIKVGADWAFVNSVDAKGQPYRNHFSYSR